jgi:hypothetical protein
MVPTYGLITTKAKRKPVLSQLMAASETLKYSEEVADKGAKVNHCNVISSIWAKYQATTRPHTSQLTTMLSRISWIKPNQRLL